MEELKIKIIRWLDPFATKNKEKDITWFDYFDNGDQTSKNRITVIYTVATLKYVQRESCARILEGITTFTTSLWMVPIYEKVIPT